MTVAFSRADVSLHNKPDDLWIIISNEVYNVTEFQQTHPGGQKILKAFAGKDATTPFRKHHNERILKSFRYKDLFIGSLQEVKDEKPVSRFSRVFPWRKSSAQLPQPQIQLAHQIPISNNTTILTKNIEVVSMAL